MTKETFLTWRKWMGWPQTKAAEHLGISKRTVQLYESGERQVPKAVELACEALARGVRDYAGPEARAS